MDRLSEPGISKLSDMVQPLYIKNLPLPVLMVVPTSFGGVLRPVSPLKMVVLARVGGSRIINAISACVRLQ